MLKCAPADLIRNSAAKDLGHKDVADNRTLDSRTLRMGVVEVAEQRRNVIGAGRGLGLDCTQLTNYKRLINQFGDYDPCDDADHRDLRNSTT